MRCRRGLRVPEIVVTAVFGGLFIFGGWARIGVLARLLPTSTGNEPIRPPHARSARDHRGGGRSWADPDHLEISSSAQTPDLKVSRDRTMVGRETSAMEPELEPTDPTQHMEVVLDPTDPAANGDPFVIETTLWDLVEGLQIEADCIAATEAEADAMVVAAVVALAGVAAQGHSDVVAA